MVLFVTGASGEIGRSLLEACPHRPLRALTRRSTPPFELPGLHWVQGGLSSAAPLAPALEGARVLLHMAALTHSRDAAAYEEVNVEGTERLLTAAQQAGIQRVVYLSTRAIGAAGGGYSRSKLRAEERVEAGGTPWVILRPAEVYGGGGRDPILDLARGLARRPYTPVLGDGAYRLSPVSVDDVVPAVLRALDLTEALGQRYTLAGPDDMTYLELVERLERILGLRRRVRVRVPLFAGRLAVGLASRLGVGGLVPDQIPRLLLAKSSDNQAAVRDLGYAPRTLEAGLAPLLAEEI